MFKYAKYLLQIMILIAVSNLVAPVAAQQIDLKAKSAILIEAQTGRVLYEKNADEKRPPASTTKMMTLIVALENANLDDVVTTSEKASGTEGSTMWLSPGEQMKLSDLLYGVMLVSGNDATIAVAEHISGSVSKFATLMNRKATAIGANSTHFTNPNGLPDDMHYSTAHDLARIAAYGYKNPMFGTIVETVHKVMPWPSKDTVRDLYNENKLLWQYEGGNGVKTGYTDAAGRCLVAAAKRDGVQLIAVVLDSEVMWTDSINLLDYGFSMVSPFTVIKQGDILKTVHVRDGITDRVPLASADDIVVGTLAEERDKITSVVEVDRVVAPIATGQKVGRVKVLYQGKEVASTNLVATADVEKKSFFGMVWGTMWQALSFMIKNFT